MLKLLLITLTPLLFIACGGGGSSSSPTTETTPNPTSETTLEKINFQFNSFSNTNTATEDQLFTLEIGYLGSASFSTENLPSWISLSTQSANKIVLQGTPNNDAAGQVYSNIILIANENGNIISSQPFQINVTDIDNTPVIQTQILEFVYEAKTEFTTPLEITDIDSDVVSEDITLTTSNGYMSASLSNTLEITLSVYDFEELLKETSNFITVTINGEFGSLNQNIPLTFVSNTALTAQSNFSGAINRDQQLTVSFNQPMDINQLTVTSNTQCEGNIQISSDNFNTCLPMTAAADNQPLNTFGFNADTLLLNVDYQLKIKSTVTSLLQDSLTEDAVSDFTTVSNLMITEISSIQYSDDMHWFEIYNSSIAPIDLSNYSFKTRGLDISSCNNSGCSVFRESTFHFPAATIQPGQYMVVRAQHRDKSYADTDSVMYIGGSTRPYWDNYGYIEIINTQSNTTSDFVLFGNWYNNNPEPLTATEWNGSSATGLTSSYGRPLKRNAALVDTNTASDWSTGNFNTPAGPNDIACFDDTDNDGIPDCSEVEGSTFAGISLYQLGARVGQRDIFIEVDYIDSTDEGVIPRQEALQKVVDSFANKNIAIHFDVGDLFDQAEGINPAKFDLGGGNEVPFSPGISINVQTGDTRVDLYDIKRSHFNFSRLPIFHYMLMAHSQNQNGTSGSSGLAELNANDLLISLGGWGLNSNSNQALNTLINLQSGTIMHELGHNLGLLHGGHENTNDKPNYLSIMNYIYQLEGLPTVGDNEGDRFYKNDKSCTVAGNMTNPPDGDYHNFIIDYSDGSSTSLDENNLIETTGLLRPGSTDVDFNCDGNISSAGYSQDINFDNVTTYLSDHNDWAKIDLNFQRTRAGSVNGISRSTPQPNDLTLSPYSITSDIAEVVPETPPSKEFFDMIRAR